MLRANHDYRQRTTDNLVLSLHQWLLSASGQKKGVKVERRCLRQATLFTFFTGLHWAGVKNLGGCLRSWESASPRLKHLESQENRLLLDSEKAKLGAGYTMVMGPSSESQSGPGKCVRDNTDSMMDGNTNFESSFLDDYWVICSINKSMIKP